MTLVATIAPLQALVCVLSALAATAVVFTRRPLRQIVVNGVYGLVLAIAFFALQAPDVALSMIVVSTIAYPVVVLATISRGRNRRRRERK
jgi:energy-converting hydrogenase B subunit D